MIVVTGTGTDVGKTVFAAALTVALGARYWKPVQAGLDGGTDAGRVAALGVPRERILPEAYRLETPCSPHHAAAIDGVTIDPDRLTPPAGNGPLVIEGAGGLLVPLSDDLLFGDLLARLGAPVVIVASTLLGTINHSLLTIEAARARRLAIRGIAFTGPAQPESEAAVVRFGGVRRLGRLPWLDPLTPTALHAAFAEAFDPGDFA